MTALAVVVELVVAPVVPEVVADAASGPVVDAASALGPGAAAVAEPAGDVLESTADAHRVLEQAIHDSTVISHLPQQDSSHSPGPAPVNGAHSQQD